MRLLLGTSGYSYKAWKGPFYPDKLPEAQMLGFYAERLDTVEINNTFYRMPKADTISQWAAQVPEGFVFAVKAPQAITHRAKLLDTKDAVDYLARTTTGLGAKLGPILFQLPPYFRKDLSRLRDFLAQLPGGMQAAFEFRHDSWTSDDVHETLHAGGAALCIADMDDEPEPPVVATAGFGYVRLRRVAYDETMLRAWAGRLHSQPWSQAFVFFKHEDAGAAPRMALQLRALAAQS